jgi:hypothetical protein
LLRIDTNYLLNAISRQASKMGRLIDTKDERESRRRHECDGEERSNDQDAAALGCCEELADSAAKIVTPMRAMARIVSTCSGQPATWRKFFPKSLTNSHDVLQKNPISFDLNLKCQGSGSQHDQSSSRNQSVHRSSPDRTRTCDPEVNSPFPCGWLPRG